MASQGKGAAELRGDRGQGAAKPTLEFGDVVAYSDWGKDDRGWEPVEGGGGVLQRVLSAAQPRDDGGVDRTVVLRFPAGFRTTAPVTHSFWEEVLLLRGELRDLTLQRTFRAGQYCCRHPGMVHGPYETGAEPCDMLVIERSVSTFGGGGGTLSFADALATSWGKLHAAGSAIYGVLGTAHLALTLSDVITGTGFFVPTARGAAELLKRSRLGVSCHTNAYLGYAGFNITHSLFVIGFGVHAAWQLRRTRRAPIESGASEGDESDSHGDGIAASTLTAYCAAGSAVVSLIAAKFFYRAPFGATALATACFAAAHLLSRRHS